MLRLFLISALLLVVTAAYAGHSSGRFSATFEQSQNRWRLQDVGGQGIVVDVGHCSTGAMMPAGLWLIQKDGEQGAMLVAPSTTRLPIGAPTQIQLRPCEMAHDRAIAVPRMLLELLLANAGAVHVRN